MGTDSNKHGVIYQLLRAGDPQVLQHLSEFAPRLSLSVDKKFGQWIPREDIEDIVSDALLVALQRGPTFDPTKAQLTTWLNQITHFTALTFLRKRGFLDNRSLDELGDRLATPLEQQRPDLIFEPSQLVAEIMAELPGSYAEVLQLYYYDGLNEDRIGYLLNAKPNAIRTRLSRARKAFRKIAEERRVSFGKRRLPEDSSRN